MFTERPLFNHTHAQKNGGNLRETADLVTFTEEILHRKLHFCAVIVPKGC